MSLLAKALGGFSYGNSTCRWCQSLPSLQSCLATYVCGCALRLCIPVQVDLRSTWTVVSSVILAFAFAFQNSVRHLFESVIFLFFIHPCASPRLFLCRTAVSLHVSRSLFVQAYLKHA